MKGNSIDNYLYELYEQKRKKYCSMPYSIPNLENGLSAVQHIALLTMPTNLCIKTTRVVGDICGCLPCPDQIIKNTLYWMAQDFSSRYPLTEGRGNLGCIKNYNASAAMRYTELKLSLFSKNILLTTNKNKHIQEYTSIKTLTILPISILNGFLQTKGIKTAIPSHNLVEVANACLAYIDNPDISLDDMMSYIKGPDFPTGGVIINSENIYKLYNTGRASIKLYPKAEIYSNKIIISEVPYKTYTDTIVNKIRKLVGTNQLPEIDNIEDETDSSCFFSYDHKNTKSKIIITLKTNKNPNNVWKNIIKKANLATRFDFNLKFFHNGKVIRSNLLEIISSHIKNYRKHTIEDLMQKLEKYKNKAMRYEAAFLLSKINLSNSEITKEELENLSISPNTIPDINLENFLSECSKFRPEKHPLDTSLPYKFNKKQIRYLIGKRSSFYEDDNNFNLSEVTSEIEEIEDILCNENALRTFMKNKIILFRDKFGDQRRTELLFSK